MEDDEVMTKAFAENWMLITNDKDFGEKISRERRPHKGVVLLRLEDERAVNKIAILQRLLEGYAEQLTDQFVVVTDPFVERGANRTHWRNIRRKQAPLAASTMFGAQRVDNRVHIDPGKAQRRDAARAIIARRGRGMPRPDSDPPRRGIAAILHDSDHQCWRVGITSRSDGSVALCFMRRLNDDTSDV